MKIYIYKYTVNKTKKRFNVYNLYNYDTCYLLSQFGQEKYKKYKT